MIKKLICYFCVICLTNMFLFVNCISATSTSDYTSDSPDIHAESAILIDAKNKSILYEKNAHEKYYPASITKLMTALLTIENLLPTDVITFSEDAIYGIERGSSHIGLDIGEQITVDQALHALLLMSANEVANGLAEEVSGSIENFAIKMTERAKELGAKNTNFINPHGLHDDNHYSTAYDMALITSQIYNHPYFLEIMGHTTYQIPPTNKTSEIRYLSQQHGLMNQLRNSVLYRSDVVGGKTGYTDIARHTLVTIAKKGDIDLIVVILKSEKDTLYQDTNTLLDYGFNSYRNVTLNGPDSTIKSLPMYTVKSGKLYQLASCSIAPEKELNLLINKNVKERDIKTTIDLPEYIELGTAKGEIVGTIQYLHNSQIIATNNLIIKNIDYLSSPYATVLPKTNNIITIANYYWLIAFIVIVVFLLFIFIRRHYQHKKRKLKFHRTLK